jgi:hypothetical protein
VQPSTRILWALASVKDAAGWISKSSAEVNTGPGRKDFSR